VARDADVPPRAQALGTDVELDVTMRISRRDGAGEGDYRITEHLRVHLAAASLPRFGPGWAYGDLHYHSQGTDNDGESAYAYRGVLQAMAAMGLDFVVAADHASNSAQATNVDPVDIASWTFIESTSARSATCPQRYRHLPRWLYLRQRQPSGGADLPLAGLGGCRRSAAHLGGESTRSGARDLDRRRPATAAGATAGSTRAASSRRRSSGCRGTTRAIRSGRGS
jgi:hypothetical protein